MSITCVGVLGDPCGSCGMCMSLKCQSPLSQYASVSAGMAVCSLRPPSVAHRPLDRVESISSEAVVCAHFIRQSLISSSGMCMPVIYQMLIANV